MTGSPLPAALPELRSDWNRLGNVFSVRFSIGTARVGAEWIPRLPKQREFRRHLSAYRSARNQFLLDVAKQVGHDIVCIDL